MFDESTAARAVKFFELLKHTKGRFHGKPFTLLHWQKQIVRDVYGTLRENGARQYRTVYLEVPKKNGKTELVAGAAIYHLFADGEANGEVYSCAAEKGQASIAFDVAVDMIDQAPALRKRAKLNLSQKKITDRKSGTFYKAISAEAYSKHGLNVSACIFDELHAQPNRDLWDVMTFGSGDARWQPIWWVITTAGEDPDRVSVCWEQHEYAQRIIAGDVVDPTWYPVIYAYEGDDIYDEENWQQANPSLGHTIALESVQEAAEKAKAKASEERLFRWLRLNQWVTTKLTTWLPLEVWDNSEAEWDLEELKGRDCYLGLDLSSTTDLAAKCLIFPAQPGQPDWRAIWHAWIPADNMKERIERDKVPYDKWAMGGWVTPTEGNVIDYTQIEQSIVGDKENDIQGDKDLYNIKEVAGDPALATMLMQRLTQGGLTCVAVPQTYVVLTNPMNQVDVMLNNGTLTHEPQPVARWCFGNTSIAKTGSGLIKYVKETRGKSVVRTKRIDLIAAMIIAMARALTYDGGGSVYEERGILVL